MLPKNGWHGDHGLWSIHGSQQKCVEPAEKGFKSEKGQIQEQLPS